MVTRKVKSVEVKPFLVDIQRQFRNLDPNNPAVWGPLPRYLLCAFISIAVVVGLWYLWVRDSDVELQAEQAK